MNILIKIDEVLEKLNDYADTKEENNENQFGNVKILVGRTIGDGPNKQIHPYVKGFTKIVVTSANIRHWGQLSPFHLRNEKNQCIENIWQFSKVYKSIEAQNQQKFGKLKWKYGKVECFDENDKLTKDYWEWRQTGMNYKKAVRFPVGKKGRFECLYSIGIDNNENKKLNYIDSRKEIYIPQYINALTKHEKFIALKNMIYEQNIKVMICEFDGPYATKDDLQHYKSKYNRNDLVFNIDNNNKNNNNENTGNVMIPTKENLKLLLNDEKHPFGHGYCIAMALQGITLQQLEK